MASQRLVLVVLGALLGLGLAEIVLRLSSTTDTPLARKLVEWDPEASNLELVGASCYRARPLSTIRYPNGTVAHVNAQGFRGPAVTTPKPPRTLRVVLLGGSTSHGWSVDDDDTIDAHLRRALAAEAARAGLQVEVVNLGLDGLDALCDLERLRLEGLGFEPDAVIVHSGINDVAAVRHADLAPNDPERGFRAQQRLAEAGRSRRSGLWRALKHWFLVARAPGVGKHILTRGAAIPGPPEPSPAGLDAFESTLREMAALVPQETTLLFSSPPSAILRKPPASPLARTFVVVDEATTQRYRDRLDERMRRVADHLARAGRQAQYVPHDLPDSVFLDDCHLDGTGNRLVAESFARALAPHFPAKARGAAL